MTSSTRKLHETIIRHLKGIVKAWEKWLSEQEVDEDKEE